MRIELNGAAKEVTDGLDIAGLLALEGANPEAVVVMRSMGIDLSEHESQPLTEQLVRHTDLLLAMTRSHQQAILVEWPDAADRVRLLCHGGQDVPDPIGGPPELYQRCAAQIKAELLEWIKELKL